MGYVPQRPCSEPDQPPPLVEGGAYTRRPPWTSKCSCAHADRHTPGITEGNEFHSRKHALRSKAMKSDPDGIPTHPDYLMNEKNKGQRRGAMSCGRQGISRATLATSVHGTSL